MRSELERVVKKIVACVLVLLLLFALTACDSPSRSSGANPIPYGTWHSEEPDIILVIRPDYRNPYRVFDTFPGSYVKDGEEIDIAVRILVTTRRIHIFNASDEVQNSWDSYFSGTREIEEGRLYLNLFSRWQNEHGIDYVVFELVEEVEVP